MRFVLALQMALRALLRRPLRTFLLAQGTAWGVAVAILPAAVLEGTRVAAREEAAALGVDRIAIVRDPTAPGPPLVLDDLEAAREALGDDVLDAGALRVLDAADEQPTDEVPDAAAPLPEPEGVTWLVATPRAAAARGLVLATGRWLEAGDPPDVCVAEAGVGARLGVGSLELGGQLGGPDGRLYRIVGITAPRSPLALATDEAGFDTRHALYRKVAQPLLTALGVPVSLSHWKRRDESVYVPFPYGRSDAPVDEIVLRLSQAALVRDAGVSLRSLDRFTDRPVVARHALVLPSLLDPRLDRFRAVAWAMFLACLAMGAVVIANLGLVTAIARQGEIALHRVEGATRKDVARQVLLEGLLLGAAGGLLGFALGAGLAELRVRLEPVAGFTWVFPWSRALLALLVSVVVGCLAAWLPARRVAAADPARSLEVE
ncbi:MAG: FtsX-like permease family protein [Planctomycetes bacterium]|nr:FtsX-like permease family protein [Planctomycetota bacterium]MCB9901890.1 FtsX-like permease family protein [Planctomycetota bacterium]